jgi:hydroxymethylpyrimidine/phosphomethylpyrimidine kinase
MTAPLPFSTTLTIAGSDPGGGAGIQADLKTFCAFGVYGAAVITALTAQNTRGVASIHEVPPEFVAAQLDAVLSDIPLGALKTGMLSNAAIVEVVADRIRRHAVGNLVVDPVMVSKSGARLLSGDAVEVLLRRLFPLALLVTPNAAEAEVLAGTAPRDCASMREAARRIAEFGPRAVLIKGGHIEGAEPGVALDVLYDASSREFFELRAPRHDARFTHGAGCTLSAGIAAGLALGRPLFEAVRAAKDFLARAIEAGILPGGGCGVPDHRVRPR